MIAETLQGPAFVPSVSDEIIADLGDSSNIISMGAALSQLDTSIHAAINLCSTSAPNVVGAVSEVSNSVSSSIPPSIALHIKYFLDVC